MTIRRLLLVAFVVGALISTALMMVDPLVDFSLLSWQMPGVATAYLFWGAIGGSASIGIAVGWFVNAVVYGAAVFAVLSLLKLLMPMRAKGKLA